MNNGNRPIPPEYRRRLEEQKRRQYILNRRRALRRRRIFLLACLALVLIIIISIITKCSGSESESADTETEAISSIDTTNHSDSQAVIAPIDPALGEIRVCIDPGHGYDDPGTGEESHYMNGVYEKDVTLAIGLKVAEQLKALGYDVVMTRENDEKPSEYGSDEQYLFNPKERIQYANELGNIDLYVSIHCDSYPDDESVKGIRLYYCNNRTPSSSFADSLAKGIENSLGLSNSPSVTGKDYASAYYVTKAIEIPSVLIEVGFVTNKEDAEKMTDGQWQSNIAMGICTGINDYAESSLLVN